MRKRNFLKTHHARRYNADRYKNPLFSGYKKTPIKKYLLRGAIAVAVIVGLPWLLLVLPWFYIDEVSVEGSITLNPAQIESFTKEILSQKRWDVIPQDHIWLVNESALQKNITEQFALQSVSVNRNRRLLNIVVDERITSLIWAQGERLTFVDQEGRVVRDLTEQELNDVRALIYQEGEQQSAIQADDIFIVFNEGGGDVSQNDQVLTKAAVEVLTFFNQRVEQNLIEIDSMTIEEPLASWATVKIRGGFDVYVDLAGNGAQQLANLEVILHENQGRLGELEYVDLRFGNRIYVK